MLRLAVVGLLVAVGCEAKEQAKARHILMKDEDELKAVQKQIEEGADFAELAGKHSTCPSGKEGGSLGTFGRGQMVGEFDKVVFDPETVIGQVYGPVKTQFGYHLIKVEEREGGAEKKAKKKKKKKTESIALTSLADFKATVLESKEVYAVEFYSGMCGSCKEFSPTWDAYAADRPPVKTAKVNIDDKGAIEIAKSLGVMEEGIPNVRVFTGKDDKGISITQGEPLSASSLKTKIADSLDGLKKKGKKTGIYRKLTE